MISDVRRIRNIGISAHIDSGKTTLTERILYYARRIHAMHDVKGKDGVGATMDHMDLERERGITITSAATYVAWRDHHINIIDTPGHVDFTIEVERALRVLDGAVLVLCGVAGVQSQSLTVDRQMRRYGAPRLAFVNKCDRTGANPERVARELREKLGLRAVLVQAPLGLEAQFRGIIDLIEMQALQFTGPDGAAVSAHPLPAELAADARRRREEMLDTLTLFSDELTAAALEDRVTPTLVRDAIRRGVLAQELVPVLVGSAYKNKGVQPLLDAVTHYLPSPADRTASALDVERGHAPTPLTADHDRPVVALAFKLDEGRYGQLTFLRVYQGVLTRGATVVNSRNGRKIKLGRLVRMHADQMEDVERVGAGDICGLFGVDCHTGDTLTAEGLTLAMTAMHVPDPVISLSLKAADREAEARVSRALARFVKEDPTFRVRVDGDSGETVVSGMGELHLDVYVERLRREYGAVVATGPPQVAYRETITRRAAFNCLHKKQTGGAGQYARVAGYVEPLDGGAYEFVDDIKGGLIPAEYIPSCDKGCRSALARGPLIGSPIVGVRVVINDGAAHAVDSSDIAFQIAARTGFRAAVQQASPQVLEPLMKVAVEGPSAFQGAVFRSLLQRRATIIGSMEDEGFARIEAEAPLAEMFGYATDLRSATQGQAEFTMEFARYAPAPREVVERLRLERSKTAPAEEEP